MYPYLFRIGPVPLPTFGVMALLAFFASVLVVRFYAKREGLDPRTMVDAIVFSAAAGLVGARLLELVVSLPRILENPAHARTLLYSAGVWLGGVIGAIGFGLWWFRRRKIPLLQGMDILAMVGPTVTIVARWGCFFSGCCWGAPTDLPWGVTFPEAGRHLHAGLPAVPIHPTQIYMSLNSILIFVVLALAYRRKRFHGRIMMLYLMLYSVTRFLIEYVRGDEGRGYVIDGVLSTSQFIGILLFLGALAVYVWLARRHATSGEPDWEPAAAVHSARAPDSEDGSPDEVNPSGASPGGSAGFSPPAD